MTNKTEVTFEYLSNLIQYKEVPILTESTATEYYNYICAVSGYPYKRFSSFAEKILKLNIVCNEYHKQNKINEMNQKIAECNNIYNEFKKETDEAFGFDFNIKKTRHELWTALLKKHGKTKMVTSLHFDDLLNVLIAFESIPNGIEVFSRYLKEKGISRESVYALVRDLHPKFVTKQKQLYKNNYGQIENEFIEFYSESDIRTNPLNFQNSVFDAIKRHYLFEGTYDDFNLVQEDFLPDIMIIRACMAQTIQELYKS